MIEGVSEVIFFSPLPLGEREEVRGRKELLNPELF